MNTIKKLSSNGFMLDSFIDDNGDLSKNKWLTVDLKLIKSKTFAYPFENLVIGDVLDKIKLKNVFDKDKLKVFVIDFIVINHNDIGVKEDSPLHAKVSNDSLNIPPSPIKSSSTLSSVAESILEREGKSLNPQFSKNPSVQDNINFSLALKLAFNSTNINGFESEDKWIEFTFDRAEKILNKINKRLK